MERDKKNSGKKINLILIKKIGKVMIPSNINIKRDELKKFLLSNLIVCMGGRAAEIILYNKILNFNYNTNYTASKLFDSI